MGLLRRLRAKLGLCKKAESDDDYLAPDFARRRPAHGLRVRILGDHSRYHCGSDAAFRSLQRVAQHKGWTVVGAYQPYDVLVVTGEGTMHHSSAGFHKKMRVLERAVDAGIPAFLVNSVWQENERTYDHVLRKLTGITVREKLSQNDLLIRHGIASTVVIDASYFLPVDRPKPEATGGGGALITDFYWPERRDFGDAPEILSSARHLPMKHVSWHETVAALQRADFLVTGRHHAVYAACVAKRPFLASEGNTHKIKGLIATAGVEIPIAQDPRELGKGTERLAALQVEYDKLFSWMDSQDPLAIFPDLRDAA
jgi:polysaccharide pyruvyl transferase WcaK-like protein